MAVFIDADNLNNATALDHVFADLQSRAERISYRRAYGRPESLKAIEAVLWKHGVRPVSNLVTNKVTTDIALTIDAVEAVWRRGFDAVVICSGDADFVPLATWLREQGCFVLCFSLNDNLFANPESFYDDVVLLEVVEKPTVSTESVPAMAPALAPVPAAPQVDVVQQVVSTPASSPAPPLPKFAARAPALPEEVARILKAIPELCEAPQHLSQVVPVLRQKTILGKTTKSTAFFARHAAYFSLTPLGKPTHVTYAEQSSVAVADVLRAVPEVIAGQLMDLGSVSKKLCDKGVVVSPAHGRAVLMAYPSIFRLLPPEMPNAVQYIG